MKSKTLILSSQENNYKSGRGILTLFQDDDLLKCRLRLYNISHLNKHCKLGIYHNKEVFSANMIERNNVYESSFVGDFDIEQDFYCAIIDTSRDNSVLLAGGTYSGCYFNDFSVFDNTETQSNTITQACEESCCNDDINDKCKTCKYKEFFYSYNKEQDEISETNIQTETQNIEETQNNAYTILKSITPQFKYIFENYNSNEELTSLIPNSKFVKIQENSEEYSIGAIYEEDNIKLICYAIKCNYNSNPPEELGKHYQWLPLDKEDPLSEGYYIVFQDSKDLKILKI